MINPIKLSPFKKFCVTIGNLPTSYMESLSYYEMLEWLCNYIEKTVIPAINNNGEAITELQNAFITLKNYVDTYFENLDIQTEINNKLDAMAESGELTEMITAYLQMSGMLTFNSVAEMTTSENLIDGSFVKTFGFYNYKDGGGSLYKIREITNQDTIDGVTLVAVNDVSLVAELVYDVCNVKQFGAKGDGETDDTEAIQLAISKNKNIIFPSGDYVVSESLDLNTDNIIVTGNHATIKPTHDGDCFNVDGDYITIDGLNIDGVSNYGYDVGGDYVTIKNCTIQNTLHNGIMLTGSHDLIDNITAIECGWDAVGNYGTASYNTIQNSNAIRCIRHGFATDPTTHDISFINCYCENIGDPTLDEGHSCFHFEYSNNGTVINGHIKYDGDHPANDTAGTSSRYVAIRVYHSNNILIDNLKLDYASDYAPLNPSGVVVCESSVNTKVINSTLINNSTSANVGYIYVGSPLSLINNKMHDVYIDTQSGYAGQVKMIKDCDIELVNKNNFANFQYALENAIISGNRFKGISTTGYFMYGHFIGCIFKDNVFDTAIESIKLNYDAGNNSSKSMNNIIEDCTFKDLKYMLSVTYVESATNTVNRCIFTGTCDYVIATNYNFIIMTNCIKHNLTVNVAIASASAYFDIFNDLKTQFDYTSKALNPSKARYKISVNGSGNVIATAE